MIQRIQSVYFLLAGIIPAFSFCVPMARYYDANGQLAYHLNAASITAADGSVMAYPWGVLVFAVVSIVMAFVCIFGYKNRVKQISLSNLLLTSLLLLALAFVAHGYYFGNEQAVRFLPSWGFVFPVLAYVFAFLGRRAVRKDEELVRAADRIR